MERLILVAALALGAVACGGSSVSSISAIGTPTGAQVSPTVAASPPPGGPAPQELIGDWINQSPGAYHGRGLTISATHYAFASATGDVVVNGSEIDFFNGDSCGLPLPDGVGRYTWSLNGTTLTFTPIGTDPCGRWDDLANATYTRK